MTGGNIHGRTETALEKSVLGVVLLIILGIIVYRRQFIPVSVPVTQAVKGTMVQGIVGTGTLQARVRVAIGANISGRVAPW
jgi:multidrug efflux pump subunit AcrA (membrane-fusion protein)